MRSAYAARGTSAISDVRPQNDTHVETGGLRLTIDPRPPKNRSVPQSFPEPTFQRELKKIGSSRFVVGDLS
jgi:hypothetical protein